MEQIIRFEGISKSFGGIKALSDVSFAVEAGEIHCLCGENGAGKSTLINICSGALQPSEGKIFVHSKHEIIQNVEKSDALGFSIVHQEIPLCANMSIAHNIFMGGKNFILDEKYMYEQTKMLLQRFKLKLEPDSVVESLSIAEQSLIQIAKAVYFKPKILILDEPTAALTNDQRAIVFDILAELKEQNVTIIYVSHRLEEVMEIGDSVTVLRDGQFVATKKISDITVDDIVVMMVGRQINFETTHENYSTGEAILQVKSLSKKGVFEYINFELKKGEILGFGGFVGSKRTDVMLALFGALRCDEGEIIVNGKLTQFKRPKDAIEHGIGLIPENRRDDALFAQMSVKDNAQITILNKFLHFFLINARKRLAFMQEMVKRYTIKAGDVNNSVMTLSGGNQQKVVIARWLSNNPSILICDEPTRGIDVGAKSEVYALLRDAAKKGMGVIVVSSELPELFTLSDRIIVMHEGKITGEFSRQEVTEEKVMRSAANLPLS